MKTLFYSFALVLCIGLAACETETPAVEEDVVVEETPVVGNTIADVAMSDDQFSTLVAALQAADLAGTLQGEGPFTVFAPTNEAFAKLPAGTVDSLLLPKNQQQLQQILLYHVVDGNVNAAAVTGMNEVTTLQGDNLTVAVNDGTVMLNSAATVTATDIAASNGVIHVIDTVLMPPSGM